MLKSNINVFILSLMFIFSCAPVMIDYHPSDNQKGVETRYVDGKKLATSKKPNSSLSIVSIKKSEYGGGVNKMQFLILDVLLKNNSTSESTFLPENVQVLGFSSENKMKVFETYRPNDFMAKVKRIQNIANAVHAMNSAIDNTNAGKTTSTTNTTSRSNINGQANSYGSISTNTGLYATGQSQTNISGSVNTVENSSTTTINHDAKRRADKESREELMRIKQMQNSENQSVFDMLLKANTIYPGQMVSGKIVVKYEPTYNKTLRINIPFSDDKHKIKYTMVN